MKKYISVLLLVAFFPLFANRIEEIDLFIEKARKEWNIPGVAVSIVQGEKVLLEKGYGYLRLDEKERVDENSIFQLASVTKAFTAAALGVQVDRGNLNWDEELIKHLPEFRLMDPYPTSVANTRDLLAHRTGLPSFGGDLLGKLGYDSKEILRRAQYIKPATSFRNHAYYSNLGYFIAGELLAAIANQPWEESVRKTLLIPLGMKRSGFSDQLDQQNVAFPHVMKEGKLQVIPWDRSGGFPAAGAMTSTAKDMSQWMKMLLNGGLNILRPETVKAMFQPSMVGEVSFSEAPPIVEGSGFSFGMGWDSFHYNGYFIIEKGGGLDGIRTVVTLIPELKLGITVLCNLNLTLFPEYVRAKFILEHLGGDEKLFSEIKKKQIDLDHLLNPPEPPKEILPQQWDLSRYTGIFESPLYGKFRILKKGTDLVVEAGPKPFVGKLSHWSNNTFHLHWPLVNSPGELVTFVFGPEGYPIELQTESLGTFRVIP